MLKELIYAQLSEQPTERRTYLGASSLGNQCERAIWYDYTQAPKEPFSDRTLMTFEIGKQLEAMLLESIYLAAIPMSANVEANCIEIPALQGHADAVVILGATTYVLEIKTASASNFALATKKGVRDWRSQYFDQLMLYMGMLGHKKGIFLVINKDTSELYEEVVDFDQLHYELLLEKAKRLLTAVVAPPRLNDSPMYFVCKQCSFRKGCHG